MFILLMLHNYKYISIKYTFQELQNLNSQRLKERKEVLALSIHTHKTKLNNIVHISLY